MSFNIMDMVKDHIGDQVTSQVGTLLGDQGSHASAGISAAVPALLQGVTARATAPGGAESLFNAVKDQDDGLLDNMGSMLSGTNASKLMESGSGLLSGLMGNGALGTLGTVVSSVSGLSKGNTSSLLGLLGPIIFGVLKRKVMGDGMGASGLVDMLKGQSSNINAAMPAGLSDQLATSGFLGSISSFGTDAASGAVSGIRDAAGDAVGNVTTAAGNAVDSATNAASSAASSAANSAANTVSSAAGSVTDTVGDAASGGSSLIKKLLPIIGLILLGWLGLKFFGGSGDDVADGVQGAADSATAAATSAADTATNAAASAADSASNAVESAAGALDVDGISSELTGVFDTAKESLGGITDVESAKAALPQLTEMGDKVEGLTGMMDKLPEAARGPLGSIVSTGVAALEPLLETVRGIPGVGTVVDPIMTPILEKLQGFAG